jgi:hypothetical protein
VLLGVAAIGWTGTTSSAPPRVADVERSSPPSAPAARAADGWIRLDRPARRDELVRNGEIVVRGVVGTGVAEVWIALESRGGKILATRTVVPVDGTEPDGATFTARFPVASPATTGRMFVMATAVDADGVPVEAIRRRIRVGSGIDAADTVLREIVVRGRVAEALGDVRIVIESADGTPVASAPVDPTGFGHGDWVPFESRFRLAVPGPGEEWPESIVAVDADGVPIDDVRYPFAVRSYLFIPAASGPLARTDGTTSQ